MATAEVEGAPVRKRQPLAPDLVEKAIALGAMAMLAALLWSLTRGFDRWDRMSAWVWLHLATITVALALTPLLMLRRRGDRWHRRLGWTWAIAMLVTATASLFIRDLNDGGFSGIHIFSAITLVSLPLLVLAARAHNVGAHRKTARGLIIGGLLIAGFFTFFPPRLLGLWFFS